MYVPCAKHIEIPSLEELVKQLKVGCSGDHETVVYSCLSSRPLLRFRGLIDDILKRSPSLIIRYLPAFIGVKIPMHQMEHTTKLRSENNVEALLKCSRWSSE
jgi:hypothetical protein